MSGLDKNIDPNIAIIDIGSNSLRLVCYEIRDEKFEITLNIKRNCRLGEALDITGKLSPRGRVLALDALKEFEDLVTERNIDQTYTIATAAMRDAEDGAEFAKQLEKETRFTVEILSGEDESFCSAYGVLSAFPDSHGVMSDLGGGSLEFCDIENGKPVKGISLPLGVLRLHMRHKAAPNYTSQILNAIDERFKNRQTLYAVGGSWRALAEAYQRWQGSADPHSHGYQIKSTDIYEYLGFLPDAGKEQLMSEYAVPEDRTKLLPYAAVALKCMIDELQFSDITFCNAGLRDGFLHRLQVEAQEENTVKTT